MHRALLGIEFGLDTVKVLELRRFLWHYTFTALSVSEQRTFEKNDLKNIQTKAAALAIPATVATTQIFRVPKACSIQEIQLHCGVEMESWLGYPLEEAAFDFQILGQSSTDFECNEVLCVSVQKQIVDQYIARCVQLGFSVCFVTLESFAAARAITATKKKTFEKFLKQYPHFHIPCGLALLGMKQGFA